MKYVINLILHNAGKHRFRHHEAFGLMTVFLEDGHGKHFASDLFLLTLLGNPANLPALCLSITKPSNGLDRANGDLIVSWEYSKPSADSISHRWCRTVSGAEKALESCCFYGTCSPIFIRIHAKSGTLRAPFWAPYYKKVRGIRPLTCENNGAGIGTRTRDLRITS